MDEHKPSYYGDLVVYKCPNGHRFGIASGSIIERVPCAFCNEWAMVVVKENGDRK